MNILALVLFIAGVICLLFAAFGVQPVRPLLEPLGIALIAIAWGLSGGVHL